MPRLTFERARDYARTLGFELERKGRVYEYWRQGDSSTVGEASTLREAVDDIRNF